ncbi:MAG: apolipoprotein N-acyltransferase [Janthinobacterium lividum]
MRLVPFRLYALAFFSALLQLLPFPLAGPVPVWRRLFCWFCLVPLLQALLGRDTHAQVLGPWRSALLGYVCGVAWFGGNCYWIYQTMFIYGGLPSPVAFGILILFSLYLGLYFALFGACFGWVRRWKGAGAALVTAPFLWVAVELARARVTGFPWDLLGYTQVDNNFLTPLAPFTGVMGLSLVVALVNVLWFWRPWFATRSWLGPALAGLLMILSYLGCVHKSPVLEPTASAILVQDNLSVGAEARGPQETQSELLANLSEVTRHAVSSPALSTIVSKDADEIRTNLLAPQLVVWPEAPTMFTSADPRFRGSMAKLAQAEHAPVVVDAVGFGTQPNETGHYDEFASASFFLPDGTYAGRYDKMHLVPFGEYTPYKQLFFFAGHLLDQLVFVPGSQRDLFSVNGHRFGVFICYESIFGDEVREFAKNGAGVLVNLSDDGWYGDTSAPWEHLDMARMRAIENRRWLLRDTNTGTTASIDPNGRLVARLPRHIRGAIQVPFGFRHDVTFYTRFGDWLGWVCALLSVSVLAGSYLQQRYPVTAQQS